ncbi:hypothetical protein CLAIMM_14604 [Cladophialophora immunda]|nr:hypothetical protein CLAIMM_14604 [Cladophialophora immunda]
MRVFLGTGSVKTVVNDGGLYLTCQGEYTGSNRSGEVPLLSLEAKRRYAGNIRGPGGQGEPYSPGLLAQEVAELLGQAKEHSI